MYRFSDVRRVHLELTTRCNAACPMCSRNVRGGFEIAGLPDSELSLADVEKILPPSFLLHLEQIWLCGNYGDPMVAQEVIEIVSYFRSTNRRLRVGMNTNGGARTKEWWQRLGGVLEYCHFGIDGLADTNHLYRRRTNYSAIIRNASAYIAAGGKATWEFIAFEHNEHQIEEARATAAQLGFQRFRVRRTGRFYYQGELQNELPVFDATGSVVYVIRPPADRSLQNSSSQQLSALAARGGTNAEYLDKTVISCKAANSKEIYVSAEGYVLPCCYMGGLYSGRRSSGKTQFRKMLDDHGGVDAVDGKQRPVKDIVESELFQEAIPMSWNRPSVSDGRLAICSSNCGASCASIGHYGGGTASDTMAAKA